MDNREIDKLVAKKVMGWKVIEGRGIIKPIGGTFSRLVNDFYPSINMDSAWLVVEKLYEKTEIRMFVSNNFHPLWEARCKRPSGDWIGHGFDEVTAPLAICKAALDAVGIEVN